MAYRKSLGNGALYARVAQRRADRDEAGKIYGFLGLTFVAVMVAIPAILWLA